MCKIDLLNKQSIIGFAYQGATKVVEYTYDAWGNHVVCDPQTNSHPTNTTFIGNINPFRYRGYYYDAETSLYYCNNRYYSPEWGRYISSARVSSLNPRAINGLNLYAYAGNNPLHYSLNTTPTTASSTISNSANGSTGFGFSASNNVYSSANFNFGSAVSSISIPFGYFDQLAGYFSGGLDANWNFLKLTTHKLLYQPYSQYLKGLNNWGIGITIVSSLLAFAESAHDNFNNINYTESEAYLATAMDLGYYAAKGIVSCAIGGILAKAAAGAALIFGSTVGGIVAVGLGVTIAILSYLIWEDLDRRYEKRKESIFG